MLNRPTNSVYINNDVTNRHVNKPKTRRRLVSSLLLRNVKLNKNQRHNIHNSINKKKTALNKINIVVNLSDRVLTLSESSILNKGLNYCISNKNNALIDKTCIPEIDAFIRSLQLRYMFHEDGDGRAEPFTGNPDWNPPPSKCNNAIHGYKFFLRKHIKKLVLLNKTKQNISRHDHASLRTLRLDKSIIIQKADKGAWSCREIFCLVLFK